MKVNDFFNVMKGIDIRQAYVKLLSSPTLYTQMGAAQNPYGQAVERIVRRLYCKKINKNIKNI